MQRMGQMWPSKAKIKEDMKAFTIRRIIPTRYASSMPPSKQHAHATKQPLDKGRRTSWNGLWSGAPHSSTAPNLTTCCGTQSEPAYSTWQGDGRAADRQVSICTPTLRKNGKQEGGRERERSMIQSRDATAPAWIQRVCVGTTFLFAATAAKLVLYD